MSNNKLPASSISIQIGENQYDVTFPKTGQLIDIEKSKKKMSDGYDYELMTGNADSYYAKTLIDMIATFNVLIPKLKKDLRVEAIADLSLVESKALVDAYLNDYLPWYNEWVGIINNLGKKEEETADETAA